MKLKDRKNISMWGLVRGTRTRRTDHHGEEKWTPKLQNVKDDEETSGTKDIRNCKHVLAGLPPPPPRQSKIWLETIPCATGFWVPDTKNLRNHLECVSSESGSKSLVRSRDGGHRRYQRHTKLMTCLDWMSSSLS